MYSVAKEFKFEASHQLLDHDGKCARLHGHSWVGYVRIEGTSLVLSGPKAGMLVDYGDLKGLVQPLVEQYLDHHHLNATLQMRMPTSEAIAQWIYNALRPPFAALRTRYPENNFWLESVVIRETCTSAAEYRE